MGEIERKNLIIGNGRLAAHLKYYFTTRDIKFESWAKGDGVKSLEALSIKTDTVLLAISDGAIEPFIKDYNFLFNGSLLIHFSGALNTEYAFGFHPLMTFTPVLYPENFYPKILFSVDDDAPDFKTVFPKLNNPCITVPKSKKAYYHSLCVMANNFTCLLWQKFYKEMIENFAADKKDLEPFLSQTVSNIEHNYKTCLTGPLARNDLKTIEKNLNSLEGDSFQQIYRSFVKMYEEAGLDL